MMHLSILRNEIVSYTKIVDLEIPVDSADAQWTLKTEMLVPNCTGAYGRKGLFRPSQVVWTSELNMIGPKQFVFSHTVCTLLFASIMRERSIQIILESFFRSPNLYLLLD